MRKILKMTLAVTITMLMISCEKQNPGYMEFQWDHADIKVSDVVHFTNSSYGFDSYEWDFGDGSDIVSSNNPSHIYTVAGTYTVKLTGFDGDDLLDLEQTLIVEEESQ